MATLKVPYLRLLKRQYSSPKSYICKSCLDRLNPTPPGTYSSTPRRPYSTSRTIAPPVPPPSGYAALPSRRILSLNGPSATHFLQGSITANMSPTTPRSGGFFAAFLNAQGRVLHDVFIYPDPSQKEGEGWLIEVDANEAETLFKHVKRYKLRSKFDVRLVAPGELVVWSVWKEGRGEGWTPHTLGGGEGRKGEIGAEDSRAPGMGRRVVLKGGSKPEVEEAEESTEEAYTVRRYLKGVAEGQEEILREAALPQESNLDYMGGIDYRKGCYVGQELTIRTHHTGVVRKRILPVMLYADGWNIPQTLEYIPDLDIDCPPPETSIARVEKRGRSAGKWLKGVGNIGLGLCRLEIMTDTTVQGEAGGFKEGDEFKFQWQGEDGSAKMVKVKAFVPTWHLTK